MNAFFFAPAVRPDQLMTLFATHPPLDQRLANLAKVSADLGRPM
jgi:heat shock protein HtpX